MRIGKLQFKEYAAKKPISVSPTGAFLTPRDVVAQPSLRLGSLHALPANLQLKLALERYRIEPDFKLGVVGVGVLTKAEVVDHLRKQTAFGRTALQAEMQYCTELAATLAAGAAHPWPKLPVKAMPKIPDWRPVKKFIWLKLPTRAVFCENTTDAVTKPMAQYRIANVHPAFQSRGFTVVALTGVNDVRTNFVPQAKNSLAVYLGGIGHGNYSLYTGHGGDHILEVGHYDPAEVKGKVIHFLSCETAAQLGPDTVAKGAKCYTGYTENFIFVWDNTATPVNEFLLFAKSDSIYDLVIANSATTQQAYNTTIQAFNAAASQVPNTVAATYLTWDRDHLKLNGLATAAILPYRFVKIGFPVMPLERQSALVNAGELVE